MGPKPRATFAVFLSVLLALAQTGASDTQPSGPGAARRLSSTVERVGRIQSPAITESSGIVASRQNPDVLWTHNDKGNDPLLFAIARDGRLLGQGRIDAKNRDWEDIAADAAGHLYVGAIGNNDFKKKELRVLQVLEPDPKSLTPAEVRPLKVEATWRLRFPAKPFDAESLFVQDGCGYLIEKALDRQPAHLFRFPMPPGGGTVMLEEVTTLPLAYPATGADLASDGRQLAVVTKRGLSVFAVDDDLRRLAHQTPGFIRLPKGQYEAVCFVPDGILMAAETGDILLCPFR
jgi:hypothetical protein